MAAKCLSCGRESEEKRSKRGAVKIKIKVPPENPENEVIDESEKNEEVGEDFTNTKSCEAKKPFHAVSLNEAAMVVRMIILCFRQDPMTMKVLDREMIWFITSRWEEGVVIKRK